MRLDDRWGLLLSVVVIVFVAHSSTASASSTLSCSSPLLSESLIQTIRESDAMWVPGRPRAWEQIPLCASVSFVGHLDRETSDRVTSLHAFEEETDGDEYVEEVIPREYDARDVWPACIHETHFQGHCASCYAWSTSTVLGDRLCIQSEGKINYMLSPQEIISCDRNQVGCVGGLSDLAFEYLEKRGTYPLECSKYRSFHGHVPTCSQVKPAEDQPEKSDVAEKCPRFYALKKSTRRLDGQIRKTQLEIMKNGPVVMVMDAYQDFFLYTGGVYHHIAGPKISKHAVRIIGWGETDSNVPYWIGYNSWVKGWGISGNGLFFIRRGTNECGIEDHIVSAMPDVPRAFEALSGLHHTSLSLSFPEQLLISSRTIRNDGEDVHDHQGDNNL